MGETTPSEDVDAYANRGASRVEPTLEWVAANATTLSRLAAAITSALVAAPFLFHIIAGSRAFLGLFEDDYYYYATIADRLVAQGRLTYDGLTTTNGFHPLWFVGIAALRAVFGRFGDAFYIALTVVAFASMVVTFELGRRFARALGASPALSSGIAAVYAFGTAKLLSNGMECVVAVPLFIWLHLVLANTRVVTPRRALLIGFVASLAILARLDIALFVPLMIVGYVAVARPPIIHAVRVLPAFCAGGILVPLYAAANALIVGTPFPVSALAKRMVTEPGFSLSYARGVAFWTVYGSTVAVVLPLGLLALVLLVRDRPRERSASRMVGGLSIVYAFGFFGLNALPGWILFSWYAFPLAPALIASLVFICERWRGLLNLRLQLAVATIVVILGPALSIRYYIEHGPEWSTSDNTLLALSYDLADRMKDREGLIAMGAIAGVVGYVTEKPILQVEGLVADRRMVEHLRREDHLGDVLREYGADYLVVSLASARPEKRDGCYLVTQPSAEWAGTRTAKMRGEICSEPIAHFFTPASSNPWSQFPTLETLVWDLRTARWKDRELVARGN